MSSINGSHKKKYFFKNYQSHIKLARFFFADTLELRPSGSAFFWSLTTLTSQESRSTRSCRKKSNQSCVHSTFTLFAKFHLCLVWERYRFWTGGRDKRGFDVEACSTTVWDALSGSHKAELQQTWSPRIHGETVKSDHNLHHDEPLFQ